VERRVAATDGGYQVDYVIRNEGIEERGIPGVRIATVEGLLVETDQYGRYNITGVSSGDWNRGRNFILKVDPSTLPTGAELSTPNPLVRRITPGLPARFDFGVKLPQDVLGGEERVDIELGEVLFAAGSDELRKDYEPVIAKIAAKVNDYGGGELVIKATGETEALALKRAQSMETALQAAVSPAAARAMRITARTVLTDPATLVVGTQRGRIVLGTVLFDTDSSVIKPRYKALLAEVAKSVAQREGGVVSLVGHADARASDAYNLALGMRRARAVFEAIAVELTPELRTKVRVEPPDSPVSSGRAVQK
jgi:outer membrane protein OmpA-like peptidoglycan-associated protein